MIPKLNSLNTINAIESNFSRHKVLEIRRISKMYKRVAHKTHSIESYLCTIKWNGGKAYSSNKKNLDRGDEYNKNVNLALLEYRNTPI